MSVTESRLVGESLSPASFHLERGEEVVGGRCGLPVSLTRFEGDRERLCGEGSGVRWLPIRTGNTLPFAQSVTIPTKFIHRNRSITGFCIRRVLVFGVATGGNDGEEEWLKTNDLFGVCYWLVLRIKTFRLTH
ncbi:hypothetical protein ZHAS_00010784 [Anopheles sinensis]|uniref:Uncharacterized protein n=1 Tax=Anopheles sinensis TaxID=74873 RepID=A0A084VYQ6_ANOSI|nr:hypothetical protein ZHAS_00010784 [Anopheles sinensis]